MSNNDYGSGAPVRLPTLALVQRIAARTVRGVWRQKRTLSVGIVVALALGSYVAFGATGTGAGRNDAAAPGASAADCADTAMAAFAQHTPTVVEQAYGCMDPAFQQRVTQQQFAAQLQGAKTPAITELARVGQYQDASGTTLVYYAADAATQSIGYIVYLNPDGKVSKVE